MIKEKTIAVHNKVVETKKTLLDNKIEVDRHYPDCKEVPSVKTSAYSSLWYTNNRIDTRYLMDFGLEILINDFNEFKTKFENANVLTLTPSPKPNQSQSRSVSINSMCPSSSSSSTSFSNTRSTNYHERSKSVTDSRTGWWIMTKSKQKFSNPFQILPMAW